MSDLRHIEDAINRLADTTDMSNLRHIEAAICDLTEKIEEIGETYAYHAGLAIKVQLLDSEHLNDHERDKLRSLIVAEVIE